MELTDLESALYPVNTFLKKNNTHGEYTGVCPLHDDNSPSLHVNLVKEVWHCKAGCGGGSLKNLLIRLGKDEDEVNQIFVELEDNRTADFLSLIWFKKKVEDLTTQEKEFLLDLLRSFPNVQVTKLKMVPAQRLNITMGQSLSTTNLDPTPVMSSRTTLHFGPFTEDLPKTSLDNLTQESQKMGDSLSLLMGAIIVGILLGVPALVMAFL